MELSVVTTMYCSEKYIQEFYERVVETLKKLHFKDYEIIFVDDGSPDNSLKISREIADKDKNVRVIELSRNFGHHKAIMTGLDKTNGKLVFLIDSDLEEPPELIEKFYNEFTNTNCDVIYGVQKSRKGGWFERKTGGIFYAILKYFGSIDVPYNITTARLMKSNYVKALTRFKEEDIVLAGLFFLTGFKQIPIQIDKDSTSTTTYSIYRKISLLGKALLSFGSRPLYMVCILGLSLTLVSLFASLYLVIKTLAYNYTVPGWTSLLLFFMFGHGISISLIGMVGVYVGRIYTEVKRRPYTIIRSEYRKS